MHARVLLAALALFFGGCLSGGGGSDPVGPAGLPADAALDGVAGSAVSDNATYLQNLDYANTHIHDYWAGADEKLLMDEAFQTDTATSAFVTLFGPLIDGGVRTGVGWLELTLPNGTFVPEGTGELVVDVDATGALRSGEMVFFYQAANSGEFTALEPGSAVSTWSLDLTPEMADVPHAKSTRWNFRLEAAGPGSLLDGELNVKVTAKRMYELDAWPRHPDFWDQGNLTKLDLGNTSGNYDYAKQHLIGRDEISSGYERIVLTEGKLVPPETQALVVTLNYERSEDPKNLINGPLILIVRDGATSRGTKVMHGNVIVDEPGRKVYALPVDGSTWDSPYTNVSGWSFQLHAPFGQHDVPPDGRTIDIGGLDVGSGTYDVGIVVYRVVPPWLAAVLPDDIGR